MATLTSRPAPELTLNDGTIIPALGLGTTPHDSQKTVAAVSAALDLGYRLIDTAAKYDNEAAVGQALAQSEVPRESVRILTKVQGSDQGYEATLAAFEASRAGLGVDYIDLYLIHWPMPTINKFVDTWKAMIRLREDGVVRSIGVSNFLPEHLQRLIDETGVIPAVNEIECNPSVLQTELRDVHRELGVQTIAFSPVGRGLAIEGSDAVVSIAESHAVSPSQVVLRWHLQSGVVPIPRSANPEHLRSNLDVFGFELAAEEIARITSSAEPRAVHFDPQVHEEL